MPMKQIQEWLGHSDFSTTANIYAHLDFNSKITSAKAMLAGLSMSDTVPGAASDAERELDGENSSERREPVLVPELLL